MEKKPQKSTVKKPKAANVKKSPVKPVVKVAKPVKEEASRPELVSLARLKRPFGSHKKKKYLGRGSGSGHGKTSTRGSKGQTSRAGRHFYLGFEGGQSPLIRKFPKRGFVSNFKKVYQIVNLDDLNAIKETVITPQALKDNGLIRDTAALIKILGSGTIKNPVTVQAHAFSKRAASQIASVGGKAEVIKV